MLDEHPHSLIFELHVFWASLTVAAIDQKMNNKIDLP